MGVGRCGGRVNTSFERYLSKKIDIGSTVLFKVTAVETCSTTIPHPLAHAFPENGYKIWPEKNY